MHATMNDHVLRTTVRGQQYAAELRQRLHDVAEDRADALRHDGERGAQAAEYAMLGGVSAAACGGLVAILKRTGIFENLVETVIGTLADVVKGWF